MLPSNFNYYFNYYLLDDESFPIKFSQLSKGLKKGNPSFRHESTIENQFHENLINVKGISNIQTYFPSCDISHHKIHTLHAELYKLLSIEITQNKSRDLTKKFFDDFLSSKYNKSLILFIVGWK